MSTMQTVKAWIGALTDLGLMLLALAIVATLLVGTQQMSFFGNVAGNITTFVKDLGSGGLAGLIALGVILWLFSNRSVS
jgi:hypothetical protein